MKSISLLLVGCCLFGFAGPGYSAPPGDNAREFVTKESEDEIEVLIGFARTPGPATRDLIKGQGWEVIGELSQINVLQVTLPTLPEEANEEALDRAEEILDQLPITENVNYVEENGIWLAHGQTTPWGVERIKAPEAHATSTGKGAGIAILDTGIDPDHETLNVAGGKAFANARGRYKWADDHGHGTHVAGTAAAVDNGIGVLGTAPENELWAVKVLDNSGSGTYSDVADGILWAADEGIEVLNMSLGGGHSDTVLDAVIYAYEEGSLLVASAGNDGGSVNYPAAYDEVIAVSATDQDDKIAGFSSTGVDVELAAPGVDILSTYPGDDYGTASGTSMSAPHVAGTAALVWAIDLNQTNKDVRGILQDTAEDIGLDDTEQGYGLVDAAEAVGIEVANVTISPFSQEDEAWPGVDATYDFTVENTGDVEDTYTLSTADSTWDSSLNIGEVTLAAGTSTTVTVTHSVPSNASAGDTDTGIIEAVSTDTGASASAEFITAARGFAVNITPDSRDGVGTPGDTVEYVYTVSNTGTEDDSYSIETKGHDWESAVSETTVTVNAGDSVDVTVSHTIPEDAVEGESDKGTLTVASADDSDSDVSASATFTTAVQEEAADPEIITFEVSTRTSGPWNRADVEWEVSDADGNLDKVKSELLDDGGNAVDSETTSVSGESAGGEHNLRVRGDADAVRLTVTDTDGNTSEETKEVAF